MSDEKALEKQSVLRLDSEKLIGDLRATAKWLFDNRDSMPSTLPKDHGEVIRTALLFVMVIAKLSPAVMEAAATALARMVNEEIKEL